VLRESQETLAEMVLYTHLEQGYDRRHSGGHAEGKSFQDGRKAIFYFDDFLGSSPW